MIRSLPLRATLAAAVALSIAAAITMSTAAPAWADHRIADYQPWKLPRHHPRTVKLLNMVGSSWSPTLVAVAGGWNGGQKKIHLEYEDGQGQPSTCSAETVPAGSIAICLTPEELYPRVFWSAAAVSGVDDSHGYLAAAVIWVNQHDAHLLQPDAGTYRQTVLCQEVGHELGLNHRRPRDSTCMAGYEPGHPEDGYKAVPHPDQFDFDEINAIYAPQGGRGIIGSIGHAVVGAIQGLAGKVTGQAYGDARMKLHPPYAVRTPPPSPPPAASKPASPPAASASPTLTTAPPATPSAGPRAPQPPPVAATPSPTQVPPASSPTAGTPAPQGLLPPGWPAQFPIPPGAGVLNDAGPADCSKMPLAPTYIVSIFTDGFDDTLQFFNKALPTDGWEVLQSKIDSPGVQARIYFAGFGFNGTGYGSTSYLIITPADPNLSNGKDTETQVYLYKRPC